MSEIITCDLCGEQITSRSERVQLIRFGTASDVHDDPISTYYHGEPDAFGRSCYGRVMDAIEDAKSEPGSGTLIAPSKPKRELDFESRLRIAYAPGGICELGVSRASDHALFRAGVLTIKQAASLSDEQIRAVPDIGPTRFEEIRSALLDFAARQAGGSADRFDAFLNDLLKS
jgi:hypothetical protein